MKPNQKEQLNEFFVTAFNEILAWEDQSLRSIGRSDISVREMHIIEAISMLEKSKKNTMANVAKILSVSPGSLTTAVNTLVTKGYVDRERSEEDRRVVLVYPTEKGREVNNHHKKFHDEMVDFIGDVISDEEIEIILKSLKRLAEFLMTKAAVKR